MQINHTKKVPWEDERQFMSEHEKDSVLLFDEMAIKKWLNYDIKNDMEEGRSSDLASQALVFMARGFIDSWKIPFSHFLSSGIVKHVELMLILYLLIEPLLEIGLYVRTMVCDQGTSNQTALQFLGVTKHQPYFMFREQKIYVLSVRNNFMASDFIVNDKIVTWRAIENLASSDSLSQTARAIPKLSEKHINPNNFEKLSVKLTAQVFSYPFMQH
ncbi:hypothetical protein PR048_009232 [Dryococelus australis]|uniref:Transposase n=1 Tax=Dryococelus australis TaxID=614101 RepID=A0ABQ9I020_9NEOP|nr:hypothetical protein PR048_009232 [Dryococelus australis]